MVFQSIAKLICIFEKEKLKVVPYDLISDVINTFFTALLSIKHIGSIDRISFGLSNLCRNIFDLKASELSDLPITLLNSILKAIEQNGFLLYLYFNV